MTAKTAVGDSAAGRDRCALGALAAAAAFVRDGLVRAGIDPARARALGPISEPDAPAADGASREADEFVFDDADSLAGSFAERIGELARRYEDGHEPDFANASLAELVAWCLARAQECPAGERNSPSPPLRGEREGPRRDGAGEGEVGNAAD